MPMFDMYCTKCNHTGEYLLRSKNEQIQCPECGDTLEKKAVQIFNIGGKSKKGDNRGFKLKHCLVDGTYFPEGPTMGTKKKGNYEIEVQKLPCGCFAEDFGSIRPRNFPESN